MYVLMEKKITRYVKRKRIVAGAKSLLEQTRVTRLRCLVGLALKKQDSCIGAGVTPFLPFPNRINLGNLFYL